MTKKYKITGTIEADDYDHAIEIFHCDPTDYADLEEIVN